MNKKTIKFGSRQAANQVRDDPRVSSFLARSDDRRSKTVILNLNTPNRVLNRVANEAADSRRGEAQKTGQVGLSRSERQQIDFSRSDMNVPKARSIKAIAEKKGVEDWMQFADFRVSADENRGILAQASREERGKRGMGRERGSELDVVERSARAFNRQEAEQTKQAKGPAFQGDFEAQNFLREQRQAGVDVFDLSLSGSPSGRDFERLEDIHEDRSSRAQAVDEAKAAPITTDPFEWVNDPDDLDFPGIDTKNKQNDSGNALDSLF